MKGFLYLIVLLTPFNLLSQNFHLLKGKALESESDIPISEVTITLTDTCGNIYTDLTDNNGFYFFDSISPCSSYTILAQRNSKGCDDGYIAVLKSFLEKDLKDKSVINISMRAVQFESDIPNLFFSFGELEHSKHSLVVNSRKNPKEVRIVNTDTLIMNRFVRDMNCNHKFNIDIIGYTSTLEVELFGEGLDILRAKKLKSYLVSRGIDPKRIKCSVGNQSNMMYTFTEEYLRGLSLANRLKVEMLMQNVVIKLSYRKSYSAD